MRGHAIGRPFPRPSKHILSSSGRLLPPTESFLCLLVVLPLWVCQKFLILSFVVLPVSVCQKFLILLFVVLPVSVCQKYPVLWFVVLFVSESHAVLKLQVREVLHIMGKSQTRYGEFFTLYSKLVPGLV